MTEDDTAQLDAEHISDPELQLIFLCCNSSLNGIDQLALTLRVVSGFTAREIADIFLSTESAMAQRLSRSKRELRQLDRSLVQPLSIFDIQNRMDAALKVIYLMFSLGYSPRCGAKLIRRDVALEAVRLARELANQKHTDRPEAKALCALLCFQASRLDAREDTIGLPVLLKNQDRDKWDHSLITAGVEYFRGAMRGRQVSRYHLEAGIASIYSTTQAWEQIDWKSIVRSYDRLEQITASPVVVINACVAQAFAGDSEPALNRLDSLSSEPVLATYAPFHIARAEMLRLLGRESEARESFENAIRSGTSTPVIQHLQQRIASNL